MKKSNYITQSAIIAATYVVLTYISEIFGLASGVIQLRISEALTILPIVTPAAVPGLVIGCLLSNIITGCSAVDIVFGTLATFLGALGTLLIGKISLKRKEFLAPIPPILLNTLILPFVLVISFPSQSVWFIMLTVFAGECLSCYAPGIVLYKSIIKINSIRPGNKQ